MSIERLTIAEALNNYLEHVMPRKALSTQKEEKRFIKNLYDFLFDERLLTYVDEVKPVDLEAYQTKLNQKVSGSTVNRRFNCYNDIFDKFRKWKFIKDDPCSDIERLSEDPAEYATWKHEEISKFLEIASRDHATRWASNVVLGLYLTGLRPGQLSAINFEDVDYERKLIWTKSKKGGKWKKYPVPLSDDLKTLIDSIRDELRQSGLRGVKAIFLNSNGDRFQPNSLGKVIRKLRVKVGNKALCAYGIRHTFGDDLHQYGVEIKTISELMGHARVTTTERYMRRDENGLRLVINNVAESRKLGTRPGAQPMQNGSNPNNNVSNYKGLNL